MARTQHYEIEAGGHTYGVADTTRDKRRGFEMANWRKPVRHTEFTPRSKTSPQMDPITTFNMDQWNAPIVYRQMTNTQRKEQRLRNTIAAGVGGYGVGAWGRKLAQTARGKQDVGLGEQVASFMERRSTPMERSVRIPGGGLAPNPNLKQAVEANPVFNRLHPRVAYPLASRVKGTVDPKALKRAASISAKTHGLGALGAIGGMGLYGAKEFKNRRRPLPYRAEYSTEGMQSVSRR